ncbi:MAG: DNA endonuclease SmrA [Pseudomonadota bacterium]
MSESKPPGEPGDDDASAFAAAMADVAPLRGPGRVDLAVSERERERQALAAEQRRAAALGLRDTVDRNPLTLGEVPPVAPRARLEWRQDGVQLAVFAKLAAGQYPIEAELDLHGRTVKEARAAVFSFLHSARERGQRAVLIAHGRGEKSETPGRLKSYLAHWLEALPEVLAFCSALQRQGGTGALYALLKKSPREKANNREQFGQGDPSEP